MSSSIQLDVGVCQMNLFTAAQTEQLDRGEQKISYIFSTGFNLFASVLVKRDEASGCLATVQQDEFAEVHFAIADVPSRSAPSSARL